MSITNIQHITLNGAYSHNLHELNPEDENAQKIIHDFIIDFFREVTPESYQRKITPSSNGKTDFTYICFKMPEEEDSSDPDTFKFVLKLMYPSLSPNYRICSKALEILGMKTPKIFIFDDASPCYKTAMEKIPPPPARPYHLGFMCAFEGADLTQLIASGAIGKLIPGDWETLLMHCGKIAVYDLLIANDDRFYQPSSAGPPTTSRTKCNAGNIMLEIPLLENDKRTLKTLFCIDNSSSSILRLQPGQHDYSTSKKNYLLKFFEAFKFFYLMQNRSAFAEIIFRGIKEQLKGQCELTKDTAVTAIAQGIGEGYKKLSETNINTFIAEINQTLNSSPSTVEGTTVCHYIIAHAEDCLKIFMENS